MGLFSSSFDKFMKAAEEGNLEVCKMMLEKGVDINAKEKKENWTALMLAALWGHAEIVKFLLEKGADVNAKDREDQTALIVAAKYGKTPIVKLLLEKGADVHVKGGGRRETALGYAVQRMDPTRDRDEYKKIEELLIAKGAKTKRREIFESQSPLFSSNCHHFWIMPPSGTSCIFCGKVDNFAKGCRECGLCICDDCWCSGWGEKLTHP